MSDTEATAPAAEQPAPSTEEQPTEQQESQPEPQAPEQAEGGEQAVQEGSGESAPAEQEEQKQEAPAEAGEAEQKEPEQQEEQPAGEAAEGEGEGEKAGEGEGEGEKKEEGEGEGEGKTEEEAEEEKEEPIVITPEGNQYWLSTEDVLAKGVPEDEVENFKTFYYKHGHSIQAWYEKLKDHTHQTEFITLSKEEIEALSAEGDPSEEQQQVLNGLKDRINGAIELYGEEGAMVRIGGRSAKDAILERDEESFIAEVQDDVINNLEVEKQSANAYALWKDEKHPGAFRRGLTKIRQSFRRSRPATAQREKPKLEEEEKKEGEEEAPKAEEAKEEGEAKPEGEEQPKEDGEAAGGAEVTIEVDVEQGADKGEEKPAEEKPAEEQPAAEQQAEEPTPAAEPEPAEPKPAEEEGEKKEGEKPAAEGEGEGEKKEGGEDGEIQKVEEGEGEKKEGEGEGEKKEGEEESQPKSKRASSRKKKPGEAHHHHYPKSKHDNLDNQIMRAFLKSTGVRYRVANGEEALQILRKSGQIRRDLNQLKPFCGIEGVQFSMSVTKWDSHIPQYPGMDLRGFVYGNELRALSQYNDSAYFPNVDHYKSTIQIKVENFFKEHIEEPLKELENYVIDFFVSPDRIYVVRLNPFYTGTGACLYTWTEHAKVLTRGPFELRIVTASKTAPEAYSSLQPFWSTMLESVLQKKKDEQRQSTSRGCVIL